MKSEELPPPVCRKYCTRIKTPIFNIQGYIDTLLDGAIEDPNINRKFLERANKIVSRMIYIVEDLIIIQARRW